MNTKIVRLTFNQAEGYISVLCNPVFGTFRYLGVIAVFLAIYGAIIGASSSWLQSIFSAVKLPALYLLTLIICFPTLYFFNVMFGSKRTFEQFLALLMTTMALIAVLLFGFAPVSLFFLLTTRDYQFYKLLADQLYDETQPAPAGRR